MKNTVFSQMYPNIAEWVENIGWVEMGQDMHSTSLLRLLDAGGMVWESPASCKTLDDALQMLEKALPDL